jgi:hypothetical protein
LDFWWVKEFNQSHQCRRKNFMLPHYFQVLLDECKL